MTYFTKPALGNSGKARSWERAVIDPDAHLAVAAWGIAVAIILAVTAWCWVH